MRNILAIADKELRSYFASPIAYVMIGLFALLFGCFFYTYLSDFVKQRADDDSAGAMERQPASGRARAAQCGGDHPLHHADDHDAHVFGREALGHDRAAADVAARPTCRSSWASSSARWGCMRRCSASRCSTC